MTQVLPPRIRALAKVVHDNDLSLFPSIFNVAGTGELAGDRMSIGSGVQTSHQAAAAAARRASRKKSVAQKDSEITATLIGTDIAHYNRVALDKLLDLLHDGTELSMEERQLFEAAFSEYSQHLRVVDVATLQASRFAAVLRLTLAIDAECSFVGAMLGSILPAVVQAHDICLRMANKEFSPSMETYIQTIATILCGVLGDILSEVARSADARTGSSVGTLAPESRNTLSHLNAVLGLQVLQLEWLIKSLLDAGGHFDGYDHVTDISMRDVWSTFVGRHVPMCSAKTFSEALRVFPPWAQELIMDVVNLHSCGAVSIFSVSRLLTLWGPYLLMDRNMLRDVSSGMFSLKRSTSWCEQMLRETGVPGDYVATLSNKMGCVNISVVTPSKNVQTIVADRSSGAWILTGVTAEDFATVADAVEQFPQLFVRCRGESTLCKSDIVVESSSGHLSPTSASISSDDVYSVFHRACFHNNVQYVTTLIQRGAAVLANTAIADPLITSRFSWTPLLCAVNNPNGDPFQIVAALLESGADPSVCDEAGCTPLYYAIANGFSGTVRLLLLHSPQLASSSSTVPLLVCLGAHHFNASDGDNQRLVDTVPCAAVVAEVLRFVSDWGLVKLAVKIIEGKLSSRTLVSSEGICEKSSWEVLTTPRVLLTPEEKAFNDRLIEEHSRTCRQSQLEVSHVLRLLRMHSFKLSCHDYFRAR